MKKRIATVLTMMLLGSTCIGTTGCSSGGASGATVPKTSFVIEEGQGVIETAEGAGMVFDGLFEAGETITVAQVKPDPVDPEVEIYAYDFQLSSGQPEGAIEIRIPYDDKGLESDEELMSVCGKFFNESTGLWEETFYRVDPEKNLVHIITDHLSTYSVFKVMNPSKRSEYIADVSAYAAYMSTKQAETLLQTYGHQGPAWQEDVVGTFLETTGTVRYFTTTNVPTLITLGGAYSELIGESFQGALTNLGISTACLQFASDAYYNGLDSRATAMSALKTTLNLALNKATTSIQLAYVGVGVIELALTEVSNFAIANKYESTKNIYEAYYKQDQVKRGLKEWRSLFEKYYEDNKKNPQQALDLMKAEIDRYVEEAWEATENDWTAAVEAYDSNGKLSKYPWPSKEDRLNISNSHKEALYSWLQSLFRVMSRNMFLDTLEECKEEFDALAALLNQEYTVTIKEQEINGQEAKWASSYVKMAPLSEKTTDADWTIQLDEKANGKLTFTLLAHETAGFPMKLEFYKTREDWEKGKVAASTTLKPFTSREKTFTILAKGEKVDCAGTFTGILNVAETGAEIEVTTVVTFEKDTDDGTFYKIVCSNNDTGSTYINGSYFVRWSTGEANIAGADFKFSADGMSFAASMKEHNGKVWGTLSGQR